MLTRLQNVFRSFRDHDVRYVVIGGVAAVMHGVPRATFDLDILIEPTKANVERLLKALLDAGLGTAALTSVEKVLENEITILNDIVRIDVQTSTPGLRFDDAWGRRETMSIGGVEFEVVCRGDLIAAKRAAGRKVDLEDVRTLERSERDDTDGR